MLKKTLLAALTCGIGLAGPAFGQSFAQWAPHASLGGAIGGRAILGTTAADNAPLWALSIDRFAHVNGRYDRAIATFDRVVRPDGSIVLMRRLANPRNPNVFGYLPKSWPPVGIKGIERVMGQDGAVVATREVIIPQHEVLAAGIPASGPPIGTLAVERYIMPDGTTMLAQTVLTPEPAVMVALGNDPSLRLRTVRIPGPQIVVASR